MTEGDLRRPAGVGEKEPHQPVAAVPSIFRCSRTAYAPNASRASPSTSRTAISPRRERKFIIADTPGHEQYTRNMATGASTADLAVDPDRCDQRRIAAVTPSRIHRAALLGNPSTWSPLINKMDLVGYDESVFTRTLENDFANLARHLGIPFVRCIPIGALEGDDLGLAERENTLRYGGPTL